MTKDDEMVKGEWPIWKRKAGVRGVKPWMPDSAVQLSIAKGYGWETHYELVPPNGLCPCCERPIAQLSKAADNEG